MFLFFILFLVNLQIKRVKIFSKRESIANSQIIKRIIESLGSMRELILSGNQSFILSKFNNFGESLRINQGYNAFITTFSRFAFEGIGLFVVAIIGYFIFNDSNNTKSVIALLGTFALGALKLLPTMQSIYRSYSLLYFYEKPLEKVLRILYLPSKPFSANYRSKIFNETIEIKNLYFKFPDSPNNLLKNINLKIYNLEKIGIIGLTGSGKTTLINLIMGLLSPTKGGIKIDNSIFLISQK